MTQNSSEIKWSEVGALGRLMILMGFLGIIGWGIMDHMTNSDLLAWNALEYISIALLIVGLVLVMFGLLKK
jgi:hypothetical protein